MAEVAVGSETSQSAARPGKLLVHTTNIDTDASTVAALPHEEPQASSSRHYPKDSTGSLDINTRPTHLHKRPRTEAPSGKEIEHLEDVDMTSPVRQTQAPHMLKGYPQTAGRHGSGPGSFITLLLGYSTEESFKNGTLGGWPSPTWDYTVTNSTFTASPIVPKPSSENDLPQAPPCPKPTAEEMARVRPHPHAFYTKQGWYIATPWPSTKETLSIKSEKDLVSPCPAFVDQCSSSSDVANKGLAHHFTLDKHAVDPRFLLKCDSSGEFGSIESNAQDWVPAGFEQPSAAQPSPQPQWFNLLSCSMPEDSLAIAMTDSEQALPSVLSAETIRQFEQAKMDNPAPATSPEASLALAWDAIWR